MTTTNLQPSFASLSTARVVRFLIVDDNRYIRYSFRTILESVAGWKVCGEAGDGAEAILKVGELRPDVIILDLQMPTMNGLEAARHIARLMPSLPIIMCTMFNTPQLQVDAHNAGITSIVDKGAKLHTLLISAAQSAVEQMGQPKLRQSH